MRCYNTILDMAVAALGTGRGVEEIRGALRKVAGEEAARWFDAEFGVRPPRYDHVVSSDGRVVSEEVTA